MDLLIEISDDLSHLIFVVFDDRSDFFGALENLVDDGLIRMGAARNESLFYEFEGLEIEILLFLFLDGSTFPFAGVLVESPDPEGLFRRCHFRRRYRIVIIVLHTRVC